MRTNWAVRARGDDTPIMAAYQQNVGEMRSLLRNISGNENSDPERVAQVVLKVAEHAQPPLRLLLGSDALQYLGQVDAQRISAAERWREVSLSTGYDAGAMPALPMH